MLKKGRPWHRYKDRIIEAVEMFQLSQAFTWKPEYIRTMDEYDKLSYIALLRGDEN